MRFVVTRGLRAGLTLLCVLAAVFFLVRLSGDPAAMMSPQEATPAQVAEMHAALGLDRPLAVQFLIFLGNTLRGDLGRSLFQQESALSLVMERLPATLELALSAFVLGIVTAFLAGLTIHLSASRRLRSILLWIAFSRQAIPVFLFGQLLILLFAVTLHWLPSVGRSGVASLVLPVLTLGTFEFGLYLRLFNSALGREFKQDYVRTAYAKGQGRLQIVLMHMLPNAMLPLITIAGINLGVLLGGAVVTESVFAWPGMGRLIVQAVTQRDYPIIMAGVLVVSIIFVVVNLAVDVLYTWLDPRLRFS